MKTILTLFALAILASGCSSSPVLQEPAALDFGDSTSQTLTTSAWNALDKGNYMNAIAYTKRCAELYGEEARKMQASLNAKAHIDKVHDYWALNDVGTSYFIMGEALTKLGKKSDAVAAFKVVRDELSYAQAWDPKGWFWSPADAAYPKIEMLSGDF
ncbi:MAG: beta-glucanase precursor [Gammaproteobacteria bacterium]